MTDLRKEARGRDCQVRIPEVCCFDPATTVLAHYRMSTGVAQKPPDIQGAWACFECHNAIDRRSHMHLDRDWVRFMHLEGVMRTIYLLTREGKIKW